MKGITPIIAIVLLLMITISMIGFAFIWFQRITAIMQNKSEAGLEKERREANILIFIDNVDPDNGKVTVRNGGGVAVDTSEIAVYVNGTKYVSCSWNPSGTILPNGYATCTSNTIKNCNTVKVTAGISYDIVNC